MNSSATQRLFDAMHRVSHSNASDDIDINDLNTQIIQWFDAGADINMIRGKKTPLHHAAEFGSVEIVQTLIERGADVNFQRLGNNKRVTPLHRAACCGHLEVVKLLVEKNADYNISNGANHTALDQAIQEGHLEVVKFLVDKGASCNGPFNRKRKDPLEEAQRKEYHEVVRFVRNQRQLNIGGPWSIAIQKNDLEAIKALIEKGVNVNQPADNLPLHLAISTQNLEIIPPLIKAGADINQKNSAQETLLMQAVLTKKQEVLELLLEKGADPNIKSSPTLNFKGPKSSVPEKTPLHVAASFGSVEMMDMLLKKGAHVNPYSGAGWRDTPLNEAIVEGHTTAVQWLLDKGASPDHSNGYYASSLCLAIEHKKTDIANLLIDKGADVNIDFSKSTFKGRPLYYAIEIQSISLVQRLLKQGAQVNAPDEVCWQETPLCHALKKGSVDIMDLILTAGANVNTPSQYTLASKKMSPLYLAVEKENIKLIKQLLERGASVNAEANTFLMDETSLHRAANIGNIEIVKLLLASNNADVNIKTKQSPLHTAVAHGRSDVVKLLIRSGAHINTLDPSRETPLHIAVSSGNVNIVKLLLEAGAQVNLGPDDLWLDTPLHKAAKAAYAGDGWDDKWDQGNYLEITQLLLAAGADVNAQSNDTLKDTPLHIVVSSGNVDIVKLLLKAGARVNPGPDDLWLDTPLHKAAYAGDGWDDKWDQGNYLEITQLLLDAGADVNAQSNDTLKDTPLHRAVRSRESKIIGLLLEGGVIGRSAVNINTLDASRNTPLHIAASSKDVDIVNLLLEAGAKVNPGPDDLWLDTPLHQAASKEEYWDEDHLGVARLLLDAGADVNAQSNDTLKDTPLHRAIQNFHTDITDLLLDRGVKVDVFDSEGYTPLHRAAAQEEVDRELIDRLIKTPGIDIGPVKLQDSLVDLCLRENDLSLWTQMMLMGLNTQNNEEDCLLKITDGNIRQEVVAARNTIQNALQKTVFADYDSPDVLRILFYCFNRIKKLQIVYDRRAVTLHHPIFNYLRPGIKLPVEVCTMIQKLPLEVLSMIQKWAEIMVPLRSSEKGLMGVSNINMPNTSILYETYLLYRSNAEIFQLYRKYCQLCSYPSGASESLHTLIPTPGREKSF